MYKLFICIFGGLITIAICEELLCSQKDSVCGGVKSIKCCENQHLKCQPENDSIDANGTCVKTCSTEGELCGQISGNRVCCSDLNLICNYERAAGGRCGRNAN